MARLLHSHDAIWNRWWPVLTGLSETDAQRGFVSSFPSVFATVKHMLDAEAYWQHRMDAGPLDTTVDTATNLASLERAWRTIQARRATWVATADPDGPVSFEASGGYAAEVKAWECLSHVIAHAHFHRGQLVTLFRQMGLAAPSFHILGPFFGEF
jgi:uncharacterized damage-inducible protein DinB